MLRGLSWSVRSWTVTCCALILALMLAACGKAPERELSAAQVALDAARPYAAYAPDAVEKADEVLRAALAEIDAQKQRTFPAYGRALELLANGTKIATEARDTGWERARSLADELIPKAENALAEARKRAKSPPLTAPYGSAQFDQQVFAMLHRGIQAPEGVQAALDEVASSIQKAKQARASGDVAGAANRARAVLQQLERLYPGVTERR